MKTFNCFVQSIKWEAGNINVNTRIIQLNNLEPCNWFALYIAQEIDYSESSPFDSKPT